MRPLVALLLLSTACGTSPPSLAPPSGGPATPAPPVSQSPGSAQVIDNVPSACTRGSICPNGTLCNSLDSEFGSCLDAGSTPCTPGGSECGTGETCTEFPNGSESCFSPPETPCTGHYWIESVGSDGVGGHLDSCMNCRPEHPEGSECVPSISIDGNYLIECDATVQLGARELEGGRFDLMTLDYPMVNPAGLARCFVGWGVHPLEGIENVTRGDVTTRGARVRIPSGEGATKPLSIKGLTTHLPAAAFQHAFVEKPPVPSKKIPERPSDRVARVFWDDESMRDRRGLPLANPYRLCPECETNEQLIEHLYPGEIFCQGLSRDPADSQFVIPFWLPHYDPPECHAPLAILSEMVCEGLDGKVHRSVGTFVIAPTPTIELPISYGPSCEGPPIE